MKRPLFLALATIMALGTTTTIVPAASESDVRRYVTHEFRIRGIPTEGLERLTLAELLEIEQLLTNGDSTGDMRALVKNFVRE